MNSIAHNKIEKEMRSLVAEILEIKEENIKLDAKFVEELGMDSMMALEVLAAAEKKYGIKISEEHLAKITTLENLVGVVQKIMGNK